MPAEKAPGIDDNQACEHAAKKLRRQSSDAATASLMNMEPGVLLRREQLTADFREAEAEAGDQADGEGGDGSDETSKPPGQRKPKARGKAKAKLAAKAKAKAHAKAKAAAKTKPTRKTRATPKAKAGAKAKATAPPAVPDNEELPEATPKSKAASRAVTKKAKTDSKAKKAEPIELEEVGGARPKSTWAGRYIPVDGIHSFRFKAIMETYEAEIAPKICRQSSFQDQGLRDGKSFLKFFHTWSAAKCPINSADTPIVFVFTITSSKGQSGNPQILSPRFTNWSSQGLLYDPIQYPHKMFPGWLLQALHEEHEGC